VSDVESCPVCSKPVASAAVQSFSLVMWDPLTHRNILVQMFCADHYPRPAPLWLKRAAAQQREEVP